MKLRSWAILGLVTFASCRGDGSHDPFGVTPGAEPSLIVEPARGVRASANTPPRLILKTTPALDRSTNPPTLSGTAPFDVQLNLCQSDDADTGDSLNWQFNFGDSRPAFNGDGTFNPDFDQFCRVDHTYREGAWMATVSVTDKHLEDQSRSGNLGILARTSQHVRIVARPLPPPSVPPLPKATNSMTFSAPGPATFVVPAGVTQVTIDAYGGEGGGSAPSPSSRGGGFGGLGGRVVATVPVAPGDALSVFVGRFGLHGPAGGGGANGSGDHSGGLGSNLLVYSGEGGGGGGAASEVRLGALILVIAGGGGGGGSAHDLGSAGGNGGPGGGVGDAAPGGDGTGSGAGGGGGGTATGFGGAGGSAGPSGLAGTPGAAQPSGNGGFSLTAGLGQGGGGGGGGYGGGGGGGVSGAGLSGGGGGGGGSSFVIATATGVVHQQGVRSASGQVTIFW